MRWNHWIRRVHRWVCIVFTLTVLMNFAAMGMGMGADAQWVGFLAIPPLLVLLFTGLWLFLLPYTTKGRPGPT